MTAIARSIPIALAAICVFGGIAFAQAPSGSTGTCKDGTYTSAQSKRGACSGHGGVNAWYADQKPAGTPLAAASTSSGSSTGTCDTPLDSRRPRGTTGEAARDHRSRRRRGQGLGQFSVEGLSLSRR